MVRVYSFSNYLHERQVCFIMENNLAYLNNKVKNLYVKLIDESCTFNSSVNEALSKSIGTVYLYSRAVKFARN